MTKEKEIRIYCTDCGALNIEVLSDRFNRLTGKQETYWTCPNASFWDYIMGKYHL